MRRSFIIPPHDSIQVFLWGFTNTPIYVLLGTDVGGHNKVLMKNLNALNKSFVWKNVNLIATIKNRKTIKKLTFAADFLPDKTK